jgi:hypothetical protein
MNINNKTTALVVTDPQKHFLSEESAAWSIGDSVRENNTIANLETLLTAARIGGYRTHRCLHYYPADKSGSSAARLSTRCTRSECSPQ